MTAEAFAVCKLGLLVSTFLEYLAICVRLCIILGVIPSLLFQVLAIAHFNRGLALSFSHAVIQDKGMLVLYRELGKLLTYKRLDLLEDLHIILRDKRDSLSSLACSGCAAHSVHVVFRVSRDIKVDDNVNRGYIETA